jgi:2'-5' RNA ligase
MQEQLSFAGIGSPAVRREDRLFFALRPDAEARERIAEWSRDLRTRHRLSGDPVAPECFHVSLCHVDDYDGLPPKIVHAACEAAASLDFPRFRLVFDRVSSFPGKVGRRPLVLLACEGATALTALRQALLDAAARAGLRCQAKPSFTPHLTLLYGDEIAERSIEPISWTVGEFVLIHSLIGKTRHIPLGRWALRG